jgi:hypothetical protein
MKKIENLNIFILIIFSIALWIGLIVLLLGKTEGFYIFIPIAVTLGAYLRLGNF